MRAPIPTVKARSSTTSGERSVRPGAHRSGAVAVLKPVWTTSSFLIYLGGLTVLVAALVALSYLAGQYGNFAYVCWTLLVLVALKAIALAALRRGLWMTSGIFGFAAVIAFGAFVAALWKWFGWLPTLNGNSPFSGFHLGLLSLMLLVFLAAVISLPIYRFPLLVLPAAVTLAFFVIDLISDGGNWSAVVAVFLGLVYLAIGAGTDTGDRRPYGFWWHFVSAILISSALLYWWHSGDTHWALVAVFGVLYIGLASATARSVWAVFGALGFIAAAEHFASGWTKGGVQLGPTVPSNDWVPSLVFAFVGFFFVALGLLAARRAASE